MSWDGIQQSNIIGNSTWGFILATFWDSWINNEARSKRLFMFIHCILYFVA